MLSIQCFFYLESPSLLYMFTRVDALLSSMQSMLCSVHRLTTLPPPKVHTDSTKHKTCLNRGKPRILEDTVI